MDLGSRLIGVTEGADASTFQVAMPIIITLKPENGRLPTLALLEAEAKKHDVKFSIEGQQGAFSGYGFAGTVVLEQDSVIVTITKKPFLVPESVVRKKVAEVFGSWSGGREIPKL